MASGTNMKSGQYVGDGAARDIPLPFNPSYVKITSPTEVAVTEQTAEMADGESLQTVYSDGTNPATIGNLASGGITLGAGKFSIGDDANINTADSVYVWVAFE